MDLHLWLAFVAASVVLLAIPGPTVMLVTGFALGEGRRSVAATAPGVALGDLLATAGSLAGLGAVLAASASLFAAVKLAGAAYLLWLGLRMWRGAGGGGGGARALQAGRSRGRMFRQAFVVTLLNPKGLVFFVAFAPQFIDAGAPYAPQAAVLVATFTALGLLNAVLWGLAAGEMRARVARPGAMAWAERVGAGSLTGAGVWTALSARS